MNARGSRTTRSTRSALRGALAVCGMLAAANLAASPAAAEQPCEPDWGVRGVALVGVGTMNVDVPPERIDLLPITVPIPGIPGLPAIRTPEITTPPVNLPAVPPWDVVSPSTPPLGTPGIGLGSARIGVGTYTFHTPPVDAESVPLLPPRDEETLVPEGEPTELLPSQTIEPIEIFPGRDPEPPREKTIGDDYPTYVATPRVWAYNIWYPCASVDFPVEDFAGWIDDVRDWQPAPPDPASPEVPSPPEPPEMPMPEPALGDLPDELPRGGIGDPDEDP